MHNYIHFTRSQYKKLMFLLEFLLLLVRFSCIVTFLEIKPNERLSFRPKQTLIVFNSNPQEVNMDFFLHFVALTGQGIVFLF